MLAIVCCGAAEAAFSGAPQLVQNCELPVVGAPHCVQKAGEAAGAGPVSGAFSVSGSEISFAPHSVQNGLPSFRSAPQFGHFIEFLSSFVHSCTESSYHCSLTLHMFPACIIAPAPNGILSAAAGIQLRLCKWGIRNEM